MIEILIITGKLALAIALGWVIGLERELSGKEAGTRTLALVTMGSTLFTVISLYGFGQYSNVDPSRIVGQILVGIGFIGAGLIIFEKHRVEGLTTAAALWATAAVGVAVGIGWYLVAIISSILIFALLFIIGRMEYKYLKKKTLWGLFEKKQKKKWWF